jgi:6-pyruvoyltetrahydropterin/6-carboxytetrahydropterin synthase
LDEKNWVVDFGGLKSLKEMLQGLFDHKTIISEDDPHIEWFKKGHELGTIDLVILPAVGCEKFAEHVFIIAEKWLTDVGFSPRCTLLSVEVREHGANSAIFER